MKISGRAMNVPAWISIASLTLCPLAPAGELETLRARCAEQERQIQELEAENSRLRALCEVAPNAVRPPAPPSTSPSPQETYTVQPGDSWDRIARKHGTRAATLAQLNGMQPTQIIRVGQKLKLPSKTPTSATATPANPAPPRATPVAPAPAASVPAATPSPSRQPKVQSVTLDGKTTFAEFAARHGISIAELNALNALELSANTVLAKGSELYVPVQP